MIETFNDYKRLYTPQIKKIETLNFASSSQSGRKLKSGTNKEITINIEKLIGKEDMQTQPRKL